MFKIFKDLYSGSVCSYQYGIFRTINMLTSAIILIRHQQFLVKMEPRDKLKTLVSGNSENKKWIAYQQQRAAKKQLVSNEDDEDKTKQNKKQGFSSISAQCP